MPDVIGHMCHEFVQTYGNAVIAMFVQKIDPTLVIIFFFFNLFL